MANGSVGGILCFVSGHGFGHAVRTSCVLREIATRRPELPIWIRTKAKASLFDCGPTANVQVADSEIDAGAVEADPYSIDWKASAERIAELVANHLRITQSEIEWSRRRNVSLILSDIPFLAMDVASALDIPCVGMSNFLWDWIYEPILEHDLRAAAILPFVRSRYEQMTDMLRLPFAHSMNHLRRVEDVPLVAEASRYDEDRILNALGIPSKESRRRVLISVRGGMDASALTKAARSSTDHIFIHIGLINQPLEENVRCVEIDTALTFSDVIKVADIVVGKPGYGMMAACIANRKRLCYLPRTGFREDQILLAEAPKFIPMRVLEHKEFSDGRFSGHLQKIAEDRLPNTFLPSNGAEYCAQKILSYM